MIIMSIITVMIVHRDFITILLIIWLYGIRVICIISIHSFDCWYCYDSFTLLFTIAIIIILLSIHVHQ
jgi:hypothetical protein